jgi:hypothetical protein
VHEIQAPGLGLGKNQDSKPEMAVKKMAVLKIIWTRVLFHIA